MTAEVTTVIGQLSIKEGVWRDDAPNQVAVREPKAADVPGAGKGDVFIVTEVQGNVDDLDKFELRLAQAIRDSYYLARGSVTASLRRAMQAGNDMFYHRNRRVNVDDRIIGGAVVLVCCQEDAFVAQIGPTAFFAVLGDHVRRYPARSVWLDEAMGPPQDEDASALGLRKIIEPNLHHVRVAPHDILVLADSRLAGQLPLNDLLNAVDAGDVRHAVKNLGRVAQAKDCSALVLEVVEIEVDVGPFRFSTPPKLGNLLNRQRSDDQPEQSSPETDDPEVPAESGRGLASVFANTSVMQTPLSWWESFVGRRKEKVSTYDAPDVAPKSFKEKEPEPEKVAPERPQQRRVQSEEEFAPVQPAETASRTPRSPDPKFGLHPQPETLDEAELNSSHDFEVNPVAQEMSRYSDSPEEKDRTGVAQKILGGISTGLLTLILLLGNGLKAILQMIVPNAGEQPRQAGMQAQQSRSNSGRYLLYIAIAVPLLVVIIVSISYLQKGRLREAEYQEYVTLAQSKINQAQEVNATEALGLMAEAEAALIQAEQIKAEQPEILDMRQFMALEADRVNKVQRISAMPQLRQYTDPGTETEQIVVHGVELYVMDEGNDRIYHHRLDDQGESLLPDDPETLLITAKGQTVDNIQVADLLDMVWMSTGGSRQTSDLVVLNSTGLLEYNPNWGVTTAALAASNSLVQPVAVDSFFGNFYVLDPQANVLLRYLPTVDGYGAPPQSYFLADQSVDLSGAVDMAIDGAVYVLYSDGRISKFLSGQPAEFNITGLTQPLSNPVSIFTAPDEVVQHLYVADAGNRRVVQLNKDGSYVRQFKPEVAAPVSFANLQDIYVDEIGGRMYVLDSNNLYLATLPSE